MPITSEYRTESADTTPEAERIVVELARERSPGEKAARVWAMMRYVHDLAFSSMRRRHPELSDDDVRMRLTALRLGPGLAAAVYGEGRGAHAR